MKIKSDIVNMRNFTGLLFVSVWKCKDEELVKEVAKHLCKMYKASKCKIYHNKESGYFTIDMSIGTKEMSDEERIHVSEYATKVAREVKGKGKDEPSC